MKRNVVINIAKVDKAGKCPICNQIKEHLIQNQITNGQLLSCCDACFFGMRYQLTYECEQCHAYQRIPHPMYRYQDNVNNFGNNTWACHGNCRAYTHWRILEHEVRYVCVFLLKNDDFYS